MTARARVRTTAEEGAGSPAGGSCLAGPATPAAGRKGWLVQLESFVGEDGMKLAELWWSIASDPTRRDSDRLEASRLLGNRGWGKPANFESLEGDPLDLAHGLAAIGCLSLRKGGVRCLGGGACRARATSAFTAKPASRGSRIGVSRSSLSRPLAGA
jgi:hypothetical protein